MYLWLLYPITVWGITVLHTRSHARWWEASAGAPRVDGPSFQTLTNAEGKSTLENLVLDCGGTAEHFITLLINMLQTLVSSEENARLGTPQRWACHRKRFRFVGREVWKMPGGCLSALCLAQTRRVKSWDANPHMDTHGWENRTTDALQPCPSDQNEVSSFWRMRTTYWPSTSRKPKPFQNITCEDRKSLRDWIIQESHL